MREIKFRAWCSGRHNNMTFTESHMEYDITLKNGQYADVESGWDIHGVYSTIPIMQYTGLKDRNGKEIYEGDILKSSNSIIKIVFKGRGFEGIYLNKEEMHELPIQNNNYLFWEIIGNIYENQDLT